MTKKQTSITTFTDVGHDYISLFWSFIHVGIYNSSLRAKMFGSKSGEAIFEKYQEFQRRNDKVGACYNFWRWLGYKRQKRVIDIMAQYGDNEGINWDLKNDLDELGYNIKITQLKR